MEPTLRAIDAAAVSRERKRRHGAQSTTPQVGTAAAEVGTAASEATEAGEPEPEPEVDGGVGDEGLQRRVKDATCEFASQHFVSRYRGGHGAYAFVARTALGAWLAAQAVKPVAFGPTWAGLLYVCWACADQAFRDGADPLEHVELLRPRDLSNLLQRLGETTPGGSPPGPGAKRHHEDRLMHAARQWYRLDEDRLEQAVHAAHRFVANDARVRLAVQGVLCNARRAQQLF